MSFEHHEDKELIFAIQNGAQTAFSELVKRYSAKSYNIAFRLVNQKEIAEDIVQECFVKFWSSPKKYDLKKEILFSTWFYRVITNRALDYKRKFIKETNFNESFEPVDNSQNIEEILDDAKFQTTLWNFINKLPEKQQLALNLCFYEGFKNKEAAEIMQISVKAIESLLIRAKNQLKKDFSLTETKKVDSYVRYR
jgi:RNA polymerase sigma-70 factor (ECF subfamily)